MIPGEMYSKNVIFVKIFFEEREYWISDLVKPTLQVQLHGDN
jgi:hypothetical protein